VLCPNTTFHASRDSARDWLAARPGLDGQILGQQAAVERGRRNSGSLGC
jgi:hypothetical protein